jgi:hypothetical protein
MRLAATLLLTVSMLSGCSSLLTPSGSAAARWERLDKQRAAKAAGVASNQICKTMNVMGSNFPQKVCSTREEWDAFEAEQLKTAEEFDRGRRSGNAGADFEN